MSIAQQLNIWLVIAARGNLQPPSISTAAASHACIHLLSLCSLSPSPCIFLPLAFSVFLFHLSVPRLLRTLDLRLSQIWPVPVLVSI